MHEKRLRVHFLGIGGTGMATAAALAAALGHLKVLAVLDRSDSFGAFGGPVFHEVRSAAYGAMTPPFASYVYGLGGRDIIVDDIKGIFRDLEATHRRCKELEVQVSLCEGRCADADRERDQQRVIDGLMSAQAGAGFDRAELEKLMAGVHTAYVESVAEGADAAQVIRGLARKGFQLIVTTSFGYMDATEQVASEFPAIQFVHVSGFKSNGSNFGSRPRIWP